jgi:hypothetical protein
MVNVQLQNLRRNARTRVWSCDDTCTREFTCITDFLPQGSILSRSGWRTRKEGIARRARERTDRRDRG